MALKDTWIDQDNTMDADAEIVNSIAHAVIDLEENPPSGGTNLTEEQLANINDVPNKVQKEDGYGLSEIRSVSCVNNLHTVSIVLTKQNGDLEGVSTYASEYIDALVQQKANKTGIYIESEDIPTFEFLNNNNTEMRLDGGRTTHIYFKFGDGEYPNDYTSGISFDSGETPTTIAYTGTGILNWVGTDCSTDSYVDDGGVTHQVSIFQPSANTHYDIVFYYNGAQFIGLVNGYVPASGNVVSV